jgi:hypothetical protein
MVLIAEHGDGDVTAVRAPAAGALALPNFTFQRASRSFCRNLAGLACQSSGMRSCLVAAFSPALLRCFGAEISEASTIRPPER